MEIETHHNPSAQSRGELENRVLAQFGQHAIIDVESAGTIGERYGGLCVSQRNRHDPVAAAKSSVAPNECTHGLRTIDACIHNCASPIPGIIGILFWIGNLLHFFDAEVVAEFVFQAKLACSQLGLESKIFSLDSLVPTRGSAYLGDKGLWQFHTEVWNLKNGYATKSNEVVWGVKSSSSCSYISSADKIDWWVKGYYDRGFWTALWGFITFGNPYRYLTRNIFKDGNNGMAVYTLDLTHTRPYDVAFSTGAMVSCKAIAVKYEGRYFLSTMDQSNVTKVLQAASTHIEGISQYIHTAAVIAGLNPKSKSSSDLAVPLTVWNRLWCNVLTREILINDPNHQNSWYNVFHNNDDITENWAIDLLQVRPNVVNRNIAKWVTILIVSIVLLWVCIFLFHNTGLTHVRAGFRYSNQFCVVPTGMTCTTMLSKKFFGTPIYSDELATKAAVRLFGKATNPLADRVKVGSVLNGLPPLIQWARQQEYIGNKVIGALAIAPAGEEIFKEVLGVYVGRGAGLLFGLVEGGVKMGYGVELSNVALSIGFHSATPFMPFFVRLGLHFLINYFITEWEVAEAYSGLDFSVQFQNEFQLTSCPGEECCVDKYLNFVCDGQNMGRFNLIEAERVINQKPLWIFMEILEIKMRDCTFTADQGRLKVGLCLDSLMTKLEGISKNCSGIKCKMVRHLVNAINVEIPDFTYANIVGSVKSSWGYADQGFRRFYQYVKNGTMDALEFGSDVVVGGFDMGMDCMNDTINFIMITKEKGVAEAWLKMEFKGVAKARNVTRSTGKMVKKVAFAVLNVTETVVKFSSNVTSEVYNMGKNATILLVNGTIDGVQYVADSSINKLVNFTQLRESSINAIEVTLDNTGANWLGSMIVNGSVALYNESGVSYLVHEALDFGCDIVNSSVNSVSDHVGAVVLSKQGYRTPPSDVDRTGEVSRVNNHEPVGVIQAFTSSLSTDPANIITNTARAALLVPAGVSDYLGGILAEYTCPQLLILFGIEVTEASCKVFPTVAGWQEVAHTISFNGSVESILALQMDRAASAMAYKTCDGFECLFSIVGDTIDYVTEYIATTIPEFDIVGQIEDDGYATQGKINFRGEKLKYVTYAWKIGGSYKNEGRDRLYNMMFPNKFLAPSATQFQDTVYIPKGMVVEKMEIVTEPIDKKGEEIEEIIEEVEVLVNQTINNTLSLENFTTIANDTKVVIVTVDVESTVQVNVTQVSTNFSSPVTKFSGLCAPIRKFFGNGTCQRKNNNFICPKPKQTLKLDLKRGLSLTKYEELENVLEILEDGRHNINKMLKKWRLKTLGVFFLAYEWVMEKITPVFYEKENVMKIKLEKSLAFAPEIYVHAYLLLAQGSKIGWQWFDMIMMVEDLALWCYRISLAVVLLHTFIKLRRSGRMVRFLAWSRLLLFVILPELSLTSYLALSTFDICATTLCSFFDLVDGDKPAAQPIKRGLVVCDKEKIARRPAAITETVETIEEVRSARRHNHVCVKCKEEYSHIHAIVGTDTLTRSCPNSDCSLYFGHSGDFWDTRIIVKSVFPSLPSVAKVMEVTSQWTLYFQPLVRFYRRIKYFLFPVHKKVAVGGVVGLGEIEIPAVETIAGEILPSPMAAVAPIPMDMVETPELDQPQTERVELADARVRVEEVAETRSTWAGGAMLSTTGASIPGRPVVATTVPKRVTKLAKCEHVGCRNIVCTGPTLSTFAYYASQVMTVADNLFSLSEVKNMIPTRVSAANRLSMVCKWREQDKNIVTGMEDFVTRPYVKVCFNECDHIQLTYEAQELGIWDSQVGCKLQKTVWAPIEFQTTTEGRRKFLFSHEGGTGPLKALNENDRKLLAELPESVIIPRVRVFAGPAGSGKTRSAAELFGDECLYVAHSRELVDEQREKGGFSQCMTHQKALLSGNRSRGIVIDEAHVFPVERIMMLAKRFTYVILVVDIHPATKGFNQLTCTNDEGTPWAFNFGNELAIEWKRETMRFGGPLGSRLIDLLYPAQGFSATQETTPLRVEVKVGNLETFQAVEGFKIVLKREFLDEGIITHKQAQGMTQDDVNVYMDRKFCLSPSILVALTRQRRSLTIYCPTVEIADSFTQIFFEERLQTQFLPQPRTVQPDMHYQDWVARVAARSNKRSDPARKFEQLAKLAKLHLGDEINNIFDMTFCHGAMYAAFVKYFPLAMLGYTNSTPTSTSRLTYKYPDGFGPAMDEYLSDPAIDIPSGGRGLLFLLDIKIADNGFTGGKWNKLIQKMANSFPDAYLLTKCSTQYKAGKMFAQVLTGKDVKQLDVSMITGTLGETYQLAKLRQAGKNLSTKVDERDLRWENLYAQSAADILGIDFSYALKDKEEDGEIWRTEGADAQFYFIPSKGLAYYSLSMSERARMIRRLGAMTYLCATFHNHPGRERTPSPVDLLIYNSVYGQHIPHYIRNEAGISGYVASSDYFSGLSTLEYEEITCTDMELAVGTAPEFGKIVLPYSPPEVKYLTSIQSLLPMGKVVKTFLPKKPKAHVKGYPMIDLPILPLGWEKNEQNAEAAVENRLLQPLVAPNWNVLAWWILECEKVVDLFIEYDFESIDEPTPFAQWLKNFTGNRARTFQRIYDKFVCLGDLKPLYFKIMAKWDEWCKAHASGKGPRAVCIPAPWFIAALGPWTHKAGNMMKRCFSKRGKIIFTSGMSAEELGEILSSRSYWYCADFTNFDGSQGWWCSVLQLKALKYLIRNKRVHELLDISRTLNIKNPSFRVKDRWRIKSGQPDTTFSNTILTIFIIWTCLKNLGIDDYCVLVAGDDSCVWVPEEYVQQFMTAHKELCQLLKLNIKCDVKHFWDTDYNSQLLYPTKDGWVLGPKPGRGSKRMMYPAECPIPLEEYAAQFVKAESLNLSHVPFLRGFLKDLESKYGVAEEVGSWLSRRLRYRLNATMPHEADEDMLKLVLAWRYGVTEFDKKAWDIMEFWEEEYNSSTLIMKNGENAEFVCHMV